MTQDFAIRFEVEKISMLTNTDRDSPITIHHDMPWKLSVKKETSARTGNQAYLGVFLNCNWESERKDWRIGYESQFLILNKGVEKMSKKVSYYDFHSGEIDRGLFKYLPFADLINSANDFIDGDKLTIECRVKVQKIIGIRKTVEFDFTQPSNGRNNVALKIRDHKIYVSRDLLATHSPVFESTFFGNFEEEKKDEIELHDIVYEEFVDLLKMIYPTSLELSTTNLHHILKLADRFQVESVLDRIINYLSTTQKFKMAAKLKIAEQYRLQRLTTFCVNSFTTVEQIKAIKLTPEYKSFSDSLRGAICDRICEL